MDQIRLIQMSDGSEGLREEVIFTDDLEAPASDFVRPGFVIDSDVLIDDVLPDGFPRNYTLERTSI